ncbi:hypothetical protein [Phenylobacterium aquaticum]|uniref:hypothetical protein n=1 Tax=Phenylobacterium aquaticum TaxID=1763816 RepID=UPI001F5D4094|nr:hypothetical protein [Phenylobacterium aquaticum]MCI3133159.1 hypothetical protein [Phenylobacterium aquaticum]
MTAIACLRIAVGDHPGAESDRMAAIVAKVAGAYLESTWMWPRRSGLVAPFSFVLVDPRARRLDARELQALARDLQGKLFGVQGEGEVSLLLFEGDQAEVMRFAGSHRAQLQALLDGEDDGGFPGRICKITPDGVESLAPPGGPVDGEALDGPHGASTPRKPRTGWWGIYYLAKEAFVGAGAAVRASDKSPLAEHAAKPYGLEHDLLCLEAARDLLESCPQGYLFMPFDFSTIVRPSARATIKEALNTLPSSQRARLAATILNVPREPSHGALAQINSLMRPHVAFLDLHVSDPAFRIDILPAGAATSVTLTLEGEDELGRLATIRRFLAQQPAYKAKRVWVGVTDLMSAREVDVCRLQNAPFLSGPAVSDLLSLPVHDLACAPDHLPYRESGVGGFELSEARLGLAS